MRSNFITKHFICCKTTSFIYVLMKFRKPEIKFDITYIKMKLRPGGHKWKSTAIAMLFGDPDENRTRVTAVKGRCLNRLTTGPYFEELCSSIFNTPAGKKVDLVAEVGLEPTTCRVWTGRSSQLSYSAIYMKTTNSPAERVMSLSTEHDDYIVKECICQYFFSKNIKKIKVFSNLKKKPLTILVFICIICLAFADVAHLVERHLAKVEVASSSLVIRSILRW